MIFSFLFPQMPAKRPDYRHDRGHSAFLDCLKNHFSSKQVFRDNLLNRLGECFDVEQYDEAEAMEMVDKLYSSSSETEDLLRTKMEIVTHEDQ